MLFIHKSRNWTNIKYARSFWIYLFNQKSTIKLIRSLNIVMTNNESRYNSFFMSENILVGTYFFYRMSSKHALSIIYFSKSVEVE